VDGTCGPILIPLNYAGIRPEDPRLYAIYVEPVANPLSLPPLHRPPSRLLTSPQCG